METEEIIKSAMGEQKADIILKGGKVVNVYTREILDANVVITKNLIVHVGNTEDLSTFTGSNTRIIDISDKIICPGLIDSHIHIESSMLSPTEFAKAVIPHGTTAVVVDPHELVNITGVDGLNAFIEETKNLPIQFFIEAPSCVPSLPGFETSGAIIDPDTIRDLMNREEIFGLAEMMNFPGVFLSDAGILAKLDEAKKASKIIEGHAPLLSGKELQAYIAAGISSDHEATNASEVLEKLRLGMKIQVREGSFAKDLSIIFQGLKEFNIDTRNLIIASDDRNPVDLVEKGHLDYSYRLLVELGIKPIEALQMMTINTATHLGVTDIIGGIAPGKRADLIVVDNLDAFNVIYVIAQGREVYSGGKLAYTAEKPEYSPTLLSTMENLEIPTIDELKIQSDSKKVKVHVIKVNDKSLLTDKETAELNVEDGFILPNSESDILPLLVLNRHTPEKKIGKGFITGLGIKNCAIASTVAHDCHQLICTGTNYALIKKAIIALKKAGGGQIVVTETDSVLLPLQFAGIMSTNSLDEVISQFHKLNNFVSKLDSKLSEPFMGLAFVALPVIPHLKLTDHGLIDVDSFEKIDVVISSSE